MPTNPFLAETLLRAQRSTFGLGVDIRREEEEERRLILERARGVEERKRSFEGARGAGRIVGGVGGGILGFLLGGPGGAKIGAAAGAGIGSFAGQKIGVGLSPGANRKFDRIGPGVYYVARGRERQKQFDYGETDREHYINELILASAVRDASRAYKIASGSSLLNNILNSPGTVLPTTGGTPVPGTYFREGLYA